MYVRTTEAPFRGGGVRIAVKRGIKGLKTVNNGIKTEYFNNIIGFITGWFKQILRWLISRRCWLNWH